MSELLPCPFCGGKGEHRQHAELPHSHNAGCADADCIGYIVAYDFFSGEEAIAAWNTRAQLAAPAPERQPIKIVPDDEGLWCDANGQQYELAHYFANRA